MTTVTRSLNTRAVRRLEKPRPLNRPSEGVESFSPSIESNISEGVMTLLDFVSSTISKENFDDVLAVNIGMLCKQLEMYGAQLEASNKAQLDKAFYLFRDASRNNRLDHVARLNLLKLIELRDSHWQPGNNFTSFYTATFSPGSLENAVNELSLTSKTSAPHPPLSPVLNPGEMIKASGKFPKPTKMPGKNYCKDEVVIRNADSGKVPSGAKERLVQITGPSEDNICHAIHLMDDTIRRNASPIREPVEKDQMGGSSSSLNSSASDESNRLANHISEKRFHSNSTNESSFDEFKYTVTVGNEVIRIISGNFGLAMTAKLVLDEHFANSSNPIESPDYFSTCKTNSNMFAAGVNDVVPSISKNLSMENESLKSSGISLSNSSSLHPSFSSLSSTPSGIGYTNLSGSILSGDLQSPPIAQPFSSYVDNNLISDSNQIANQSILSSSASIISPVLLADSANNVILSSPVDHVTPLSLAEVNDGRGKALSLNQSLSALLSVTSTRKDEPKIKQYSKDALEALRSSNISLEPPQNWNRITEEFPSIIKSRGAISAPTTPTASNAPSVLFACASVPTTPPAYYASSAPTAPAALSATRPSVTTTITDVSVASCTPADPTKPRPPDTATAPAMLSAPMPHAARASTAATSSSPESVPASRTSNLVTSATSSSSVKVSAAGESPITARALQAPALGETAPSRPVTLSVSSSVSTRSSPPYSAATIAQSSTIITSSLTASTTSAQPVSRAASPGSKPTAVASNKLIDEPTVSAVPRSGGVRATSTTTSSAVTSSSDLATLSMTRTSAVSASVPPVASATTVTSAVNESRALMSTDRISGTVSVTIASPVAVAQGDSVGDLEKTKAVSKAPE